MSNIQNDEIMEELWGNHKESCQHNECDHNNYECDGCEASLCDECDECKEIVLKQFNQLSQ